MQNEGTIKKTSAEVYEISSKGEFACIAIQCHEKAGRIIIHSTFGNWGFYWASCGSGFKQFLAELDMAYTAIKFGAKDVFDEDATLKAMIADIEENVCDGDFFNTAIEAIKDRMDGPEYSFEEWFHHQDRPFTDYFDNGHDLPMRHNPCPQFKGFWDNLWPLFIQKIKSEDVVESENPMQL